MNRVNFIKALAAELSEKVRPSEIHQLINYYDEMIEDLMEEGYTEEEAVARLGSPKELIQAVTETEEVVVEIPRRFHPFLLLILVLGFPLWGSLLLSAALLILSLFNNHLVCAFHHWHDWCHYVYRWDRQRCLKSHADGGWFLSLFKSVRRGDFLIWFRAALPDRHL